MLCWMKIRAFRWWRGSNTLLFGLIARSLKSWIWGWLRAKFVVGMVWQLLVESDPYTVMGCKAKELGQEHLAMRCRI